MSGYRSKFLRRVFEQSHGYSILERKNADYKEEWRRFKKHIQKTVREG